MYFEVFRYFYISFKRPVRASAEKKNAFSGNLCSRLDDCCHLNVFPPPPPKLLQLPAAKCANIGGFSTQIYSALSGVH